MPDDIEKPATIDVAAITKTITEAVTKTVTDAFTPQLTELAKNQKVLADTLAATPATDASKKDAGADAAKKADATAPLTAEAVAKIVADSIAADRKAQADESGKKSAREALVAKIAKDKLGGDADLASALTGDDEAALNASADKLAATVKKYKPDFGGAVKDGGDTPNAKGTGAAVPAGNLSKGAAAFASSIKLPTA